MTSWILMIVVFLFGYTMGACFEYTRIIPSLVQDAKLLYHHWKMSRTETPFQRKIRWRVVKTFLKHGDKAGKKELALQLWLHRDRLSEKKAGGA